MSCSSEQMQKERHPVFTAENSPPKNNTARNCHEKYAENFQRHLSLETNVNVFVSNTNVIDTKRASKSKVTYTVYNI